MEDLRFHNYLRMSATQLETLTMLIGHDIYKLRHLREPISVSERIVITLRYLASGDSIHSLSYQHLVGLTTISNIINETNKAIWKNLQPIVLEPCTSSQKWLKIADDYERLWNFPHCIGAMDGKHIVMQCPDNAGSAYFNYKGTHSIVLLGVCDANYRFTFIDVGSYGRRSDGGIFAESSFGKYMENGTLNIPPPAPIADSNVNFPYCFVGDEAFPLKPNLLRPFPGKFSCTKEKRVFNYRLSRARRTIENSFGILANRWQIFRRPIRRNVVNTINIVKATVCLHNWLRTEDLEDKENVKYITPDVFEESNVMIQAIVNVRSANNCKEAVAIRQKFCDYFNNEGAVDCQYKYI